MFVIASGEANVYGSSYYWNLRISSFKQVACLILQGIVNNTSVHFENYWKSDGFWIWKIQVQGSSPIGWNCRRFSLVPFYRIHRIKKRGGFRLVLRINRYIFFGGKRSHWSIWIVAMNSNFSGQFWMLAGRLHRSFLVHHFRSRNFRWRHHPPHNPPQMRLELSPYTTYVLDQVLSTCITFSLRPQYDDAIRTTTLVRSCHVKVEFH